MRKHRRIAWGPIVFVLLLVLWFAGVWDFYCGEIPGWFGWQRVAAIAAGDHLVLCSIDPLDCTYISGAEAEEAMYLLGLFGR